MFTELIKELSQRRIKLEYNNGILQYSGPQENISKDLLNKIKENKEELIRYYWPLDTNSNLMPIRATGTKTPLVLVHGEHANYFLKEALGNDQPILGFTHLGADGGKIGPKNVEQYVDYYLEQLKKVLPPGKVILAGYSLGGLIAFELACRLEKMGYEVPLLIILDTAIANDMKLLFGDRPLKNFAVENYQKLKYRFYQMFLLFNLKVPVRLRRRRMFNEYFIQGNKYKFKEKYNGRTILIRASETNIHSCAFEVWREYANIDKIIEVEGSHITMLRDEKAVQGMIKTFQEELT